MKHDLRLGDCFEQLSTIADNSIDLCITDPPYFIDGLDDNWNTDKIEKLKDGKKTTIKSLPGGMKFDRDQGPRFNEFMSRVSKEVYRVLKPGAFYISFSQARLYHHLAMAVESSGFDIRDMLGWTYQGQAKAFSQNHIIQKQKNLTEQEKQNLIAELQGWKTAQLKPCIEPMTLAQKPCQGKLIDNWQQWGVGLMNTDNLWDNSFPGNIIPCSKPSKNEKGEYNDHVSVKPLAITEHLIKLFSQENARVLDPFLGSGTTAVACKNTNRYCVGFEISPKYWDIIQQRMA